MYSHVYVAIHDKDPIFTPKDAMEQFMTLKML